MRGGDVALTNLAEPHKSRADSGKHYTRVQPAAQELLPPPGLLCYVGTQAVYSGRPVTSG